jgi:Tol biopolymer transport system component
MKSLVSVVYFAVADDASVLVFASERDGSTRIYFKIFCNNIQTTARLVTQDLKLDKHPRRREAVETEFSKTSSAVLDAGLLSNGPVLFDKPSMVGDSILFVSTKEPHHRPRHSWAAVYSTSLKTQKTIRLTPRGTADLSPSVSPSGE